MLGRILTAKEKAMPEQVPLFEAREPSWAERLRQRLEPSTRERVKAILVEMAQAGLWSPAPVRAREVSTDEQ
jgi:hypothetical protein